MADASSEPDNPHGRPTRRPLHDKEKVLIDPARFRG